MKLHQIILLTGLLGVAESVSYSQEASVETNKEAEAAQAARDQKLREEERVKALMEKKPVFYGGFLVDAARAEKKSRFLSLRQPRDPKNDIRNVAVDERTGKARGFVLFRLEF